MRKPERRSHRRFEFSANISHDLLTHNNIYDGKLCNFSEGGLYFESNQTIYPGEEVFLKFKDQQNSINEDMIAQLPFGVKIVWRRDRSDSPYLYGYGAHYIDSNDSLVNSIRIPGIDLKNLEGRHPENEKDPRAYPRRQYHKPLRLSYQSRNYTGEFKDISRGGGFIKTDIKFTVGKPIKIAVPGNKIRNTLILIGWIVRITAEGFGVKFDERSNSKLAQR